MRSTRPNNLAQLDFDSEIDASVLGDGAFKVTWDAARAARARVGARRAGHLRLVAGRRRLARLAGGQPLPAVGRGGAAALRRRRSARRRRAVSAPSGDASTRGRDLDGGDFELWLDGALVEAKANPYGFIPFVIYPNLREPKQFWGVSDIDAVRESTRELNRALSQLSMILELSGNPVAVLENVTESQDIAVAAGRGLGAAGAARGPTCSTCCRAAASACTSTT